MPNGQIDAKLSSLSAFDTEHLKSDLKGRSVRGGAATMLGQSARFVIQIASTMVLARLLAPADFGLIAMVTAVTGFAALFKDLGLSMATIQKAKINHEQVSTLFWINLAVSGVITMVTVTLAPAIAWFYSEPRLTLVTVVLSLVFLFGGLTVQHQALLERQMRFTALAAIQVFAMAAGVCAAIVGATLGAGYWALVMMQVTSAFAMALGVWSLSDWQPGRPVRHAGVKSMLLFGGNITGFNIVNYFARNADNLLIGKTWGSGPLGLYSKAYALLMLPISQINAPISVVAVPTLSRLQQDPERYRKYYSKAVNFIAFATTPLILVMVGVSDDLIHVLLGKQWAGASKIFMTLAIAAVGQPISNSLGWVFISTGQANRQMKWALFASPIIVASFALGLPWGAVGVATGYALSCHALRIPSWWFAVRFSPVALKDIFNSIWRSFTASMIMFTAVIFIQMSFAPASPLLRLLLSGAFGLFVYVAVIAIWPRARTEALDLLQSVNLLWGEERRN